MAYDLQLRDSEAHELNTPPGARTTGRKYCCSWRWQTRPPGRITTNRSRMKVLSGLAGLHSRPRRSPDAPAAGEWPPQSIPPANFGDALIRSACGEVSKQIKQTTGLFLGRGFLLLSRRFRTPSFAAKTRSALCFIEQLSQKSLGAKSLRSRRHVCHSCAVPGDS